MKPSKGRVVEFVTHDGQRCVGMIVKVWSDACVNAAGWNEGGTATFGSSLMIFASDTPTEAPAGSWSWPQRV